MVNLQEVVFDDDTPSIYDSEKLAKVQHTFDNEYNVFVHEKIHPANSESTHDTYVTEHDGSKITSDTPYMDPNGQILLHDMSIYEQDHALIISLFESLTVKVQNCTVVIQKHKDENEVLNKELERYKIKVKSLQTNNDRKKDIEKAYSDVVESEKITS